jgi:flagella basal body P-ring formation protein FlgA
MIPMRLSAVCLSLFAGLFVAERDRCVAGESAVHSADRSRDEKATITIRPNATVDGGVIRLAHVAQVTGGDAALREQLKQLDLEEGLSMGESIVILPPQIEFRLRIAGIDIDRVSLRGPGVRITGVAGASPREEELVTHVAATANATTTTIPRGTRPRRASDLGTVSLQEGALENEILQAARNCVLAKLPWPADEIDMRLVQPMLAEVRRVESAAGYECVAELRTTGPAMGRVQVRVIAESAGKPAFDVPVLLDVRHFDEVVLTTKGLERGHVITAADVYLDRQDVTELADYCSTTSQLIGTTSKRSMRALLPLRFNDVEVAGRADGSILIKRRERVKMVARIGPLNVTVTGEALQEGRLGETIRLRNVDSNANVQGRVISPTEVEIAF